METIGIHSHVLNSHPFVQDHTTIVAKPIHILSTPSELNHFQPTHIFHDSHQFPTGMHTSKMVIKAAMPDGNINFNANNNGYKADATITHSTDNGGNLNAHASGSGDWHGHNTYSGGLTYKGDSGFSIGGNMSHGPSGNSYGISGGIVW